MPILTPDIRTDLKYLGRHLTEARALVKTADRGNGPQLARVLDAVVECAVSAGARADGMSDAERNARVRRVRKALGYTYP